MQDNTKHTYTHYEGVNLDTFDKKIQVIEKVKNKWFYRV